VQVRRVPLLRGRCVSPRGYRPGGELMARVRVGSLYYFHRAGWDLIDPKRVDICEGTLVRVINMRGCPPANTMGHCFVERAATKEFLGLVCTASLQPVKQRKAGSR
jgi:hypothetical protein